MHTIECPVSLPLTCTEVMLKALASELWQSAPKSSRFSVRKGYQEVLDHIRRLDLDRLESALYDLDKLTIKVRSRVLDVVCDFIGFLVEVAADPRLDGAEWKLEHLEGKLQLHVKDDCRQCQTDAAEVCVPRSYPEFCSDECALRWLDRKGSEIAKFEDLDVTIGAAVEKALEENKKDVEQEIKEAIADAASDLVDSEDNAVLEIIRLHGRDSRIDCATAARKLEVLFRSGQLSL